MAKDNEGWCILRTRGKNTLNLARTLAEDGYEVWTPVETRMMRLPRTNARREAKLAIMPSYIFARACHLTDLILLADMPVKPRRAFDKEQPSHANFSVMRCPAGLPIVSDRQLQALRVMEAKLTPKKKVLAAKSFDPGVEVRVMNGSFGGMIGLVEQSTRGQTVVCFNGRYLVKIDTCLLNENGVYGEHNGSDEDDAALAA